MKDARVLRKKHLPKKKEFFNYLTCQHITKDEYDFAQKVWNSFSCKTFQDYMEIYLLADCLLLCDVFENFRSNCLLQYNIDPCYYFSAPHFTFNAILFDFFLVIVKKTYSTIYTGTRWKLVVQ